jgi:hypothetical protein
MSTDKDKLPPSKIADLPESAAAEREADKVMGGRMRLSGTETGDVTPGPNGGDTG